MKEERIVDLLKKTFKYPNAFDIVVGIGDDCAVIDIGLKERYLVFTVDNMVDKVHFISSFLKPNEIASRLVRINLSDIYSMGDAKPCYCLTTAGFSKDIKEKWIDEFSNTLKNELNKFGVKNIGGNLTRSSLLSFSMTVVGYVKKNGLLRRTGALDGHLIVCAGKVGFSSAAVNIMKSKKRKYLTKNEERIIKKFSKPQLYPNLAKKLAYLASCLIDNSDGIIKTVSIISSQNSLKAVIDANLIKDIIDRDALIYFREKKLDPISYTLASDDYNLIFTVCKKGFDVLKKRFRYVYPIGHLEKGNGIEVKNYEGKIKTFEHF